MKTISIRVDSDPTSGAEAICTLVEAKLGVLLHADRDHGSTVQGHVNTSSNGKIDITLYEAADVEGLQRSLNARGVAHQIDAHTKSLSKSDDGLKVEIAEVLAQNGFTLLI